MLRLGSLPLHGIMWIPAISITVLRATCLKLLPSATLKRWHKFQEQKTNGSTVSGKDWEGEDGQPCSKMQRERSGGTWSSRYSKYLPCNCAQWFWLFDLGSISLLPQAHGCDECDANVWAGWKTGVRNAFSEHFFSWTFSACEFRLPSHCVTCGVCLLPV